MDQTRTPQPDKGIQKLADIKSIDFKKSLD
jgi:hypothetical protein